MRKIVKFLAASYLCCLSLISLAIFVILLVSSLQNRNMDYNQYHLFNTLSYYLVHLYISPILVIFLIIIYRSFIFTGLMVGVTKALKVKHKLDIVYASLLCLFVSAMLSSVFPVGFYQTAGIKFQILLGDNIGHLFIATLKEEIGRLTVALSMIIVLFNLKNKTIPLILLGSIIFSIAHSQNFYEQSMKGTEMFLSLLQMFLCGCTYSFVMVRYGFVVAWLVHFLCDLIAFDLFYIPSENHPLIYKFSEYINFMIYGTMIIIVIYFVRRNDLRNGSEI